MTGAALSGVREDLAIHEREKPMNVLIGYDGSDCARAAIEDLVLAGLPPDADARVIAVADPLVKVPPDDSYLNGGRGRPASRLASTAHALAADATREASAACAEGLELVTTLFPGWGVRGDVLSGAPDRALVRTAAEWKADLVVVGASGCGGLQRVVLGSVSKRVLARARCSVRVARTRERSPERPPRLIVATDGSPYAERAVEEVARRRWPEGTEARALTALHPQLAMALAFAPNATKEDFGGRDARAVARRCANRAARRLRAAGIPSSVVVEESEPMRLVVEQARKWAADCVFMGAKGHGGIARVLLGSVSTAVASRAPCSVEVVRGVGAEGE